MKTETYTVIDYHELEGLIKEHLGVPVEYTDYQQNPSVRHPGWMGVAADLESGNDQNHIFDMKDRLIGTSDIRVGWKREIEDWEEGYQKEYLDDLTRTTFGGRVQYFLAKLIEKDVLTDEYPIMVQVMW